MKTIIRLSCLLLIIPFLIVSITSCGRIDFGINESILSNMTESLEDDFMKATSSAKSRYESVKVYASGTSDAGEDEVNLQNINDNNINSNTNTSTDSADNTDIIDTADQTSNSNSNHSNNSGDENPQTPVEGDDLDNTDNIDNIGSLDGTDNYDNIDNSADADNGDNADNFKDFNNTDASDNVDNSDDINNSDNADSFNELDNTDVSDNVDDTDNFDDIEKSDITDNVDNTDNSGVVDSSKDTDDNADADDDIDSSDDGWYEYETDTETFIYGLIFNELSTYYDVFSAVITLQNGKEVYGIGYTDYSEGYKAEGKTFFSSGFIAFCDQPFIPQSEYQNAIEIERLGDDDDEYGFVYTFSREPFSAHLVVFDKYVTYGVDDDASIFFTEIEYDRDYLRKNFNEALGTLYSYDEERVLNDLSFGKYIPLGGVSVSNEIDFRALEAEVNKIIQEQNYNFSTVDVKTAVYIAQEALNSYLLSLQEETFLGYRVEDLVELSKQIDPMSCIRITADGVEVVDIQPTPPPTPSGLMKWLTGIVAGIAVVGGVVLSIYGMPQLGGAVIGAAVQVFTEVIVDNKTLANVDWRKVVIASVAGAISANLGLFGDAVIGGATEAAFTLIDGGSLSEVANSFAIGTAAGVALGAAFKLVGKGVSKIASKLPTPPKVVKVSAIDDALNLDGKIANKLDDPAVDAATYQAKKQAKNAIDLQLFASKADDIDIISKYGKEILDNASEQLDSLDHIVNPTIKGNSWTGGHSSRVLDDITFDPSKFDLITNPNNGVKKLVPKVGVKLPTLEYNGVGKPISKAQTFFPDTWTDSKIAKAINVVAEYGNKVDGSNFKYRGMVEGVEIEIIKVGDNIRTGYPIG